LGIISDLNIYEPHIVEGIVVRGWEKPKTIMNGVGIAIILFRKGEMPQTTTIGV
jgi:hypothetical protein